MAPSVHHGWEPDRLRRYRERHGLTLDQVADAIRNLALAGFTPPNATFQTVGRHERGESYPGPRYQRAYCELYAASEVALGFRAALPSEAAAAGGGGGGRSAARGSSGVRRPPRLGGLADLDGLAQLAGMTHLADHDDRPGSPASADGPPEPRDAGDQARGTQPSPGEPTARRRARGRAVFARAVTSRSEPAAGRSSRATVAERAAARAALATRLSAVVPRPASLDVYEYDALTALGPAAEFGSPVDASASPGTDAPAGAQEAAARALTSARLRGAASRAARVADAPLADALSVILAAQREVEDTIGSAPLLGPVTAQLAALVPLVFEARGPAREAMVDIAAQWAQFAGWLHANTGATAQARVWLDRAAEWAAESDNRSLTANILSYKGHLAWEAGAVGPLIGLSQAAQRVPDVYPGQLAYDAGQEARGHAMAGDAQATDRKLGEAREMWCRAGEHPDGPPAWSYYFSPAFARLQEGLAHRYLARVDPRRARQAAVDLRAGLTGLPDEMRRAEWAAEYVYHLAVAHIHTAEPEQACADTLDAAAIARATGSRRVMKQVRRLHNQVAERWPTLPAVTELTDRLQDPERPARPEE
ncbi:helix-turn-helix transcriptional regulator [Pseudofrankia saprophytica]|uniref:helix-turn-helix transcriptional regulator n=1 Tax=Pseudofrankia saprophytica TaxID=298655 RepID=UPI000234C596|nr:helix-turn-helix transcriptional regulator [Pseudofrankia saprophytica]